MNTLKQMPEDMQLTNGVVFTMDRCWFWYTSIFVCKAQIDKLEAVSFNNAIGLWQGFKSIGKTFCLPEKGTILCLTDLQTVPLVRPVGFFIFWIQM